MQILITPASLCSRPAVLEELAVRCDLTFSPQQLPADLSSYQIIILGNEWLGAEEIARASSLQLVVRYGVTVHNVDLEALWGAGILLAHCPTANGSGEAPSASVAEYVLAAIFHFAKQLHQVNGRQPEQLRSFLFDDIKGKTLGIIGLGAIGRCLAIKANGLGLRVAAYNRSDQSQFCAEHRFQSMSIEEVILDSDFLSINVTLNDQTRHLLDQSRLRLLKPSAYLINTAQADVLDPVALYQMLQTGNLAGAALDFIYEEFDFSQFDNVLITPHISSRSVRDMHRKVGLVTLIIQSHLLDGSGIPEHLLIQPYQHLTEVCSYASLFG